MCSWGLAQVGARIVRVGGGDFRGVGSAVSPGRLSGGRA